MDLDALRKSHRIGEYCARTRCKRHHSPQPWVIICISGVEVNANTARHRSSPPARPISSSWGRQADLRTGRDHEQCAIETRATNRCRVMKGHVLRGMPTIRICNFIPTLRIRCVHTHHATRSKATRTTTLLEVKTSLFESRSTASLHLFMGYNHASDSTLTTLTPISVVTDSLRCPIHHGG